MKFAFHCRVTAEGVVMIEAENEAAAWKLALEGDVEKMEVREEMTAVRKPIYRRMPSKDDFGL